MRQSLLRYRSFSVFFIVMVISGSFGAFGQATTGSVSGVVTDQNGAAVPGAIVKVINLETRSEREAIASAEGLFTIPRLPPGQYLAQVTKPGFRTLEMRPVVVALAQDTSIQPQLQLGDVTETVVVEASAPLVETTTAQVSNTFSAKAVAELPAVRGQLDFLALLSPGVINGISAFINANGPALSANGQRQKSNNFTIDGQDNNDTFVAGPMLFLSNTDVVKEFSIITNNFSAEYGRNQGAIVNIVTRSGTNDLHGALYGYHRNGFFDANTFDNNRNGLVKPRFNVNTDGGTIGGPFKKDKAFFFTYFQSDIGRLVAQNTSNNNSRVITPSGIATLINRCGATRTLAAYRDAGPFAQAIGNPRIVPGSVANSTYAPIAGDLCGSTPFTFETAVVTRTTPTPFKQYDFGMKYDFLLTPRDTLNTRYLFQDRIDQNLAFAASGYEFDRPERSQNLGVTYTRQLSNRQVNEFRFNYGRFAFAFEGGNTFPVSQIGKNVPRFRMPGGFLSFGLPVTEPENRIVETFQFVDNWSLQVGRHALKTGAEVRRQMTEIGFLPFFNGQYTFNSIQNFVNNVGDVTAAAGQFSYNLKETDTFLYFQDDFRVRPNFTLNLGVRYEYTGQPMNLLNEITVARESDPSKAFWLAGLPLEARVVPALKADKNNVAPRIGFAYTPKWWEGLFGRERSVFRGGFSRSFAVRSSTSSRPLFLTPIATTLIMSATFSRSTRSESCSSPRIRSTSTKVSGAVPTLICAIR